MTPSQLAALAADIAADPELSVIPHTPDGAVQIASAYNADAAPAFYVYRTALSVREIKQSVVWTEYIGRSAGERGAFELLIQDGVVNAADVNVRAGFLDIFSGPSGANTRANLATISYRAATRAEKLFATGTGTTGSPATMSFEGVVSYSDVLQALGA